MPTRSLASVIPADDDTDSASQAATTTPAAEPSADESSEKPTEKKSAPRKSRGASKPPPTQPADSAAGPAEAAPTGEQRTGRARIPKTGPVTRVTVDLAVTEQTQLEQLAGKVGREIGRGHGKRKVYPQHLMRVAIRRLLSDDDFRREVAADLAENRDELRRPQR